MSQGGAGAASSASEASGALSEPRCVGSSGRLAPGNTCRVKGCRRELAESFNLRYRICAYHYRLPSIELDGEPSRYCQQCARFQHVDAFDGERRSCRESLERHRQRRQKKREQWGGEKEAGPGPPRPDLVREALRQMYMHHEPLKDDVPSEAELLQLQAELGLF
ncbi:hypothetical protein ABPG75_011213 [Micractinium tetrahymenae]